MIRGLYRPLLIAFALLLPVGACSRKIGDRCQSSIDCQQDTETERFCDISQPEGYCTIEGCDEHSCPSESVCIRFFPRLFLSKTCGPDCGSDEICLEDNRCVPRRSERRFCQLGCDDDGDCRDGYECRAAGTKGSVALLSEPGGTASFCAPVGE